MRIEFTVRHAAETCDVAVTAPAPVALAALQPELARVAGAPRGLPVWSGDRLLAGTAALGEAGLRTGAVLSFGGPHRATPAPGVLALHQVGPSLALKGVFAGIQTAFTLRISEFLFPYGACSISG